MEWRQTIRRCRVLVWSLVALDAVAVAAGLFGAAQSTAAWPGARKLFELLAGAHFCLVAMLGPTLGSAAIAEERRERTAGLLALTDLTGFDVVWSKFASRAATVLLIAAVGAPLLALPVLLGAPVSGQLPRLLLLGAVAGVTGTAVGLTVATLVFRAAQATILGLLAMLLLFVILPSAVQLLWLDPLPHAGALWWLDAWSPLFAFHHELIGVWPAMGWARCAGAVVVGAMLTAALLAASSRSWTPARLRMWDLEEAGPDLSTGADEESRPLDEARRHMAAAARFTPAMASGFFLVMFIGIVVVEQPRMTWEDLALGMMGVYFPVTWFLVNLAVVLYAARGFVVEKESGTLELLVSTPLSNAALVWNQIGRALRRTGWVPATLVGCQLALWAAGGEPKPSEAASVMMVAGTPWAVGTRVAHFCLVLVAGLWLSAWCRNLTRALLGALVAFLVLTWVCAAVSDWLLHVAGAHAGAGARLALAAWGLSWRLATAGLLLWSLIRNLRVFASR
jgi:ABC-type transport system involved in multi-copper enzyme maturation permease subunit